MSILITPTTKIIVQGITGDFGGRHAKLSLDYGTQVAAGVTPGKGGQFFEHAGHKVPIFNSVADAAKATGATVSVIFVPPPFAGDAILECVERECTASPRDAIRGTIRRVPLASHGPRAVYEGSAHCGSRLRSTPRTG
jgi:succinyl-CoA synthetase alpha subunit